LTFLGVLYETDGVKLNSGVLRHGWCSWNLVGQCGHALLVRADLTICRVTCIAATPLILPFLLFKFSNSSCILLLLLLPLFKCNNLFEARLQQWEALHQALAV